jgi:hypothetical protein
MTEVTASVATSLVWGLAITFVSSIVFGAGFILGSILTRTADQEEIDGLNDALLRVTADLDTEEGKLPFFGERPRPVRPDPMKAELPQTPPGAKASSRSTRRKAA